MKIFEDLKKALLIVTTALVCSNCRNNLEFRKEQVEYLTYLTTSNRKIDFDQPLITGDYEDLKSGYGNTKRGFL